MTDDHLSSEEINALFQETSSGKEDFSNMKFLSIEKEALKELFTVSIGSLSTSLSEVFMQDVTVSNIHMNTKSLEKFGEEVKTPYVEAALDYEGEASGQSIFIMNPQDAQDLADIYLVATGHEEDNDGNVNLGLTEVVKKIMNSIHIGLNMTSNSTISSKFINLQVVSEVSNSSIVETNTTGILIELSFEINVGSIVKTTIKHVISGSLAKELVQLVVSEEEIEAALENREEVSDDEVESIQGVTDHEKIEQQHTVRTNHEITSPDSQDKLLPNSSEKNDEWRTSERRSSHRSSLEHADEPNIQSLQFSNFNQAEHAYGEKRNLNMLLDIPLQVTVELGRTKRVVKDILELSHGSILELDKLAGEPVDLLINNKLIAKGEVVVIDENFGVRVTDILSAAERLSKLR